jgi:hypothetical protein
VKNVALKNNEITQKERERLIAEVAYHTAKLRQNPIVADVTVLMDFDLDDMFEKLSKNSQRRGNE